MSRIHKFYKLAEDILNGNGAAEEAVGVMLENIKQKNKQIKALEIKMVEIKQQTNSGEYKSFGQKQQLEQEYAYYYDRLNKIKNQRDRLIDGFHHLNKTPGVISLL